jgi:hypothetical protein
MASVNGTGPGRDKNRHVLQSRVFGKFAVVSENTVSGELPQATALGTGWKAK